MNDYTLFLSNTFISNTRLKPAKKNQAIAKQHPETELLTERKLNVKQNNGICFNEIM